MRNDVIFITINDNYFSMSIAFLNSIEKNWSAHPKILCHYTDLSNEQLSILQTYTNLELIPIQLDIEFNLKLPMGRNAHMSITYARLRAWSRYYDIYDNILYLDIDTLVLKPLDELLQMSEFIIFKDPTPLFFRDNDNPTIRELLGADQILDRFDSNNQCEMGNAGVILLPKKYRTSEHYDCILDIATRYDEFNFFGDQTIINIWRMKNNITLNEEVKYNFFSIYFNDITYSFKDVSLLHFVMTKPTDPKFMEWELVTRLKQEMLDLFNHYLKLKQ